MTTVGFRSASRCTVGGCVEVAQRPSGVIAVRSSENPGRVLTFTTGEWRDFLTGVRDGDFDPLT